MNDTTSYLHDLQWTQITREERFFCAELYFNWSRMKILTPVIGWLNDRLKDRPLPEDENWSVGYEVCFYRDYIHEFLLNGTASILDKKVPGTEDPFMFKRTFDLTLFHPKHIVIIEAKANEGLSDDQVTSFERDRRDLDALFDASKVLRPKIHLVLLCAEHYRHATRAAKMRERFDGSISWNELAEKAGEWGADARSMQAFLRADSLMASSKRTL